MAMADDALVSIHIPDQSLLSTAAARETLPVNSMVEDAYTQAQA
jgi:hypothetical protein